MQWLLFKRQPTEMGRIWVRFLGFHKACVSTYHALRKRHPSSEGITNWKKQIRKRFLLWVEELERDNPFSGWIQQSSSWISTTLSSHGSKSLEGTAWLAVCYCTPSSQSKLSFLSGYRMKLYWSNNRQYAFMQYHSSLNYLWHKAYLDIESLRQRDKGI